MKDELFIVVFTNFQVREVYASGYGQAIILAQAEQILKGECHIVDFVKDDENRVVHRGGLLK